MAEQELDQVAPFLITTTTFDYKLTLAQSSSCHPVLSKERLADLDTENTHSDWELILVIVVVGEVVA